MVVIAVVGVLIALLLPADDATREAARAKRGAIPRQPEAPKTTRVPERLEIRGIENAYRLSPRLLSGGQPGGSEAFSALKELGVRTIISVDGATPDVEAARSFGLRYVHLPVGYDGIPRAQAVRIVKAVARLPAPVFVHCHHAKHRGPAAVAICGLAAEGWTEEQALGWLKRAGTSTEYRGLYASAKDFEMPTPDELSRVGNAFPERAKVTAFVETMVRVDERWENLKAAQTAGFKAPSGHPDIDPPHEALQLAEQFREATRLSDVQARGSGFVRLLEAAERQASLLRETSRMYCDAPSPDLRKRVEAAFIAVGKSCSICHTRYGDN
jgi:protein tyrosine phosphatase (PTP) superfamily phosphohydrolase (DUF442 family)